MVKHTTILSRYSGCTNAGTLFSWHVPFEGTRQYWKTGKTRRLFPDTILRRSYQQDTIAKKSMRWIFWYVDGGPMSVNWWSPIIQADSRKTVWSDSYIANGEPLWDLSGATVALPVQWAPRGYPQYEKEIGWWPTSGEWQTKMHCTWNLLKRQWVFTGHGETFDYLKVLSEIAESIWLSQIRRFSWESRWLAWQFHPWNHRTASAQAIVENCADDAGWTCTYVQSESEITTASRSPKYQSINQINETPCWLFTTEIK